jgi:hypothetical protein
MDYRFWLMAVCFFGGAFIAAMFHLFHCRFLLDREHRCHAAARWLANRNLIELSALRTVLVSKFGVYMTDIRGDLQDYLRGHQPYMGQMVCLSQVPEKLRGAVIAFNNYTDKLVDTKFDTQWLDTEQTIRIADLEAAMMSLSTKNYEDYVQQVAEEAGSGITTATVQLVLLIYSSIIREEAERHVGLLQDPEEILLSIY